MAADDSNFLARLAQIFRDEGDTATADALDRQRCAGQERELDEADCERVERLGHEATRLDNRGAHDQAEPLLAEALAIVEAALGPGHLRIADHLNDLARCRFNAGKFEQALRDYQRLLRLVEHQHEQGECLAALTRYMIERCLKGARDSLGVRRLQQHMDRMLFEARDRRTAGQQGRLDRMLGLAERLVQRGRHAAAIRLYERWIDLRLREAQPDDEQALLDIRCFALGMLDARQPTRAAGALRGVVLARNRRLAWVDDRPGLLRVLRDWQAALAAMGDHRSAREAAERADALAADIERSRSDAGKP